MYISAQTKQAYAEVDNFIELLTEEDRDKIPEKLRTFFKEEKDKNYIKQIDIEIPIKEQNLKEETLALIALLNIKYICDDNKERERLTEVYHENDIKYKEILKEKYNEENLFKNRKNIFQTIDENVLKQNTIIEYKEKSFILKLMDSIKHFFRRK